VKSSFLKFSGGTMTGALRLANNQQIYFNRDGTVYRRITQNSVDFDDGQTGAIKWPVYADGARPNDVFVTTSMVPDTSSFVKTVGGNAPNSSGDVIVQGDPLSVTINDESVSSEPPLPMGMGITLMSVLQSLRNAIKWMRLNPAGGGGSQPVYGAPPSSNFDSGSNVTGYFLNTEEHTKNIFFATVNGGFSFRLLRSLYTNIDPLLLGRKERYMFFVRCSEFGSAYFSAIQLRQQFYIENSTGRFYTLHPNEVQILPGKSALIEVEILRGTGSDYTVVVKCSVES
jgi:hypothetical protein